MVLQNYEYPKMKNPIKLWGEVLAPICNMILKIVAITKKRFIKTFVTLSIGFLFCY
jgi:hypothetical protein